MACGKSWYFLCFLQILFLYFVKTVCLTVCDVSEQHSRWLGSVGNKQLSNLLLAITCITPQEGKVRTFVCLQVFCCICDSVSESCALVSV